MEYMQSVMANGHEPQVLSPATSSREKNVWKKILKEIIPIQS